MQVRPLENYSLMGTNFVLDKTKNYEFIHATNQPDWEEKGKIFVFEDEDGPAILLEKGEYEFV